MSEVYQRLSKIFARLCAGEELRIGELAKEYGVSTKTIQRDFKERLASRRIIREGNRFFLNPNKASKSAFVLEVLQNIAQSFGGEFALEAYKILGSCCIDKKLMYPMQNLQPKISEILSIQKAIEKRMILQMRYYTQELKGVEPLELVCCGGIWYLCVQQEYHREYLLLSEISECKIQRKRFVLQEQREGEYQISLFVYPEVAQEIKSFEFTSNQEIVEANDGSLIVDFVSDELLGVEQEVLKRLPYVVVLEPQELKDRIEKKILDYTTQMM